MFYVNKIEFEWKSNYSIRELLKDTKEDKRVFKVPGHGNIVIVNGEVLGVYDKHEYIINDEDSIMIFQAVGGG